MKGVRRCYTTCSLLYRTKKNRTDLQAAQPLVHSGRGVGSEVVGLGARVHLEGVATLGPRDEAFGVQADLARGFVPPYVTLVWQTISDVSNN